MECSVLRCDQPVATVHIWNSEKWARRIELAVCAEHGARLDTAGEDRAYQEDGRERTVILMGSDLDGTGDDFVTQISVTQAMHLTAPDGSSATRVVLDTKRRGSNKPGHIEFLLSEDSAAYLAQALMHGQQDS